MVQKLLILWKETFLKWRADHAPRLAAALSYHTAVSLIPLLVIMIAIAGFVFDPEAVQEMIVTELGGVVGENTARTIETLIENGRYSNSDVLETLLGAGILIFAASGVFNQLQGALNTIWGAEQDPNDPVNGILQKRLISFLMVIAAGLLLIVSLVISSVLAYLNRLLAEAMPGPGIDLRVINFVAFLVLFTGVFGLVNRVIPDVQVAWQDVWVGGAISSLLFALGNFGVSLYITYSRIDSIYGVAGSIIVLLLWVYYTTQIVLFGATFTEVYARRETIWT